MNYSLIDAHCHLDFPVFEGEVQKILDEMQSAGIERIVIPGVRREDWSRVLEVAARDRRLSPCLGIHPWYVEEHDDADIAELDRMLIASDCVALGECGLDRIFGDVEQQLPLFEAQVEIACQREWPLVVHSVRTHEPMMKALDRQNIRAGVLIHAFAGSPEQASQMTSKGVLLGVGGVITYERARKSRAAIAEAPLESLVLETDAPDMPPEGVEKGHNSPLNLGRVFKALCDLRSESPGVLADALNSNARRFFRF
ncbi:TatD family hydrolase [Hydrocarboniclastica marina]|uniref:TatD family deoxyribonuclease n=1 Tax=Hydrocarboniclastica marina TaxID=2259620 RepID=A0A4V1D8G6_9ALTE|nr:TatD family hydrolase [Hydrocarboniclastica marina]QCF25120.1 TatD family deoxyribonuclease [Hydrocarboniclastica marina]